MMKTAAVIVAGMVVAVVFVSLGIGITAPDGSISDDDPSSSAATTPTPSPSASASATPSGIPTPSTGPSSSERAPAKVAGTWPGRPAAVTVNGDTADWCPAVKADVSADARRTFGDEQAARAACAAVSFVFDHRYSRLSLPRSTYRTSDFKPVLADLTQATASTFYRPRINEFINNPDVASGSARLGLVLLDSAGPGHRFYGPKDSTQGYHDRAVWINPDWSTVKVTVDRAKSVPRVVATFTASASIPVFNVAESRDDMMTVPTQASYVLRQDGDAWCIAGWTVTDGDSSTAPLSVR